jgi:hypothetical protein
MCPTACSDGAINIKGEAVPKNCGGCPAANGFLYVYRGDLATGTQIGLGDQQSVDTTVSCSAGEKFQICEKDGVMITSSVKFTFTGQSTGACNLLGTGTNWFGSGCTP